MERFHVPADTWKGVPVTCSFLLAADLRQFWRSNTLPAAYLFHADAENDTSAQEAEDSSSSGEVWDLADLTLQCGRKGDAFKLALAWVYYGSAGFERRIDNAFAVAAQLASLVQHHDDLLLVSENPPPCLQVCFYFAPEGSLAIDELNTRRTRTITDKLLPKNFLIDYAPGDHGLFFRVVVGLETPRETVFRLVNSIVELGNGL